MTDAQAGVPSRMLLRNRGYFCPDASGDTEWELAQDGFGSANPSSRTTRGFRRHRRASGEPSKSLLRNRSYFYLDTNLNADQV